MNRIDMKVLAKAHADTARFLREERDTQKCFREAAKLERVDVSGEPGYEFDDEAEKAKAIKRAERRIERANNGWRAACYRRTLNRNESRHLHLARMFLAGVPLEKVEAVSYEKPVMAKVLAVVIDFHGAWPKVEREGIEWPQRVTYPELKRSFEDWAAVTTFCANRKLRNAPERKSVSDRVDETMEALKND